MRGSLEKIDSVSDIKTDHKTLKASFKIADAKMDQKALKAKLDELAKNNKHMKDWSFDEEGSSSGKNNGKKNKKG